MITEQEILELAHKEARLLFHPKYNEDAYFSCVVSYKEGFKQAIEQFQPKWISVTERLPEVNHSLWMYKRDHQYPHTNGYCLGSFDGENWLYMSLPTVNPTHWMYLPLPPNH